MKRGFTLPEVLIVIAIIGLLSSVVIASVNKSRDNTSNAATLANLRNYELALQNYAQENDGTYPYVDNSTRYCLGGTTCVIDNITFYSSPAVEAALAPFLGGPPLPAINNLTAKDWAGNLFQGAYYMCSITNGKCVNVTLWVIEKGNNTCERGTRVSYSGAFQGHGISGRYNYFPDPNAQTTICGESINNL